MTVLIALTILANGPKQVEDLPHWAVLDFSDDKSARRRLGSLTAKSLLIELAKTKAYRMVAGASQAPTGTMPEELASALNVGSNLGATVVCGGKILDFRIEEVRGLKRAAVALRLNAYDVPNGYCFAFGTFKGESALFPLRISEESLFEDALRKVAATAVRSLRSRAVPQATILSAGLRTATVDGGSRSGFFVGSSVYIFRRSRSICLGRVSSQEADKSEITFERVTLSPVAGDRVRGELCLTPLPPVSESLGYR